MAAKKGAKWFGSAVSEATDYSTLIPLVGEEPGPGTAPTSSTPCPRDPHRGGFPPWLCQVIEPHIAKCRKTRDDAIALATKEATSSAWWGEWDTGAGRRDAHTGRAGGGASRPAWLEERDLRFDACTYLLREAFCDAAGCDVDGLASVHETEGLKEAMLARLTDRARNIHFQKAFDAFVRGFVLPIIDDMYEGEGGVPQYHRYQAFPCVRCVRPGDFSIGPHADCAYGHSPASINLYLPLSHLYGSNALFLESTPGAEDWHPIEGPYGTAKLFMGGTCAHFTTENNTPHTRVSLDFRVIPSSRFVASGWSPKDSFSAGGYYATARKAANGEWLRCEEDLLPPDARMGFPFTRLGAGLQRKDMVKD